MSARPIRIASATALALLLAAGARADLAAWDQAKVTDLTRQLVKATTTLYDSFYKQPKPPPGSGQYKTYYRLQQKVRVLRNQAKQLAGDVKKGGGQVETQPAYEDLMRAVRSARDDAPRVFAGSDVVEKATAVRNVLNQLGPYYDASFQPLEPVTH